MTDGEFYEYLKKQDKLVREDENYFFTTFNMKNRMDAAKKEFPPIMQKMLKEQGKHAVGWRLTDLQKWFEKWFGDEK